MKLILQYDPWDERAEAQRASDALTTLGIAVHLCELRRTHMGTMAEEAGAASPVNFEPVVDGAK